jgi:hypothetical protein
MEIELCGLRNNGSSRTWAARAGQPGDALPRRARHAGRGRCRCGCRASCAPSFTPQGATDPQRLDLRLICGSGTDLRLAVADGTFRGDLYHAIAVGQLDVPALAQRHDDIPLLAQHMLFEAAVTHSARRCAA